MAASRAHDPLEQPTEVLPTAQGGPITLKDHPRFSHWAHRARELAGLVGFALATWSSLGNHALAGALLRGIAAGLVCRVVVGIAAVLVGRQLVVAELRARQEQLKTLSEQRGATGGRR